MPRLVSIAAIAAERYIAVDEDGHVWRGQVERAALLTTSDGRLSIPSFHAGRSNMKVCPKCKKQVEQPLHRKCGQCTNCCTCRGAK